MVPSFTSITLRLSNCFARLLDYDEIWEFLDVGG